MPPDSWAHEFPWKGVTEGRLHRVSILVQAANVMRLGKLASSSRSVWHTYWLHFNIMVSYQCVSTFQLWVKNVVTWSCDRIILGKCGAVSDYIGNDTAYCGTYVIDPFSCRSRIAVVVEFYCGGSDWLPYLMTISLTFRKWYYIQPFTFKLLTSTWQQGNR